MPDFISTRNPSLSPVWIFFQAYFRTLMSYIHRIFIFLRWLHIRTAPPTHPTMAALRTELQGLLMCVKYYPWHECYWQTWLDIWGSELSVYLMHIHLLYPTGLSRALELCHLATLQQLPKYIVTLIMQICILFSSNTCIRSLLYYWSWDTGPSERNQVEIWGNLLHIFISTHHNNCHIKWESDEKKLWCLVIHYKSLQGVKGLKCK